MLKKFQSNPKTKFREFLKGESCINFFSNAKEPIFKLSNLFLIKEGIEVLGLRYASSEHAYQAQKFIAEQRE